MSLERCADCGQPWTQHTTGGCPARVVTELREPESLDEAALAAAERAYWTDDGVSRHNLAAAIQAYLGAAPLRGPSPRLPDTFVERAIRAAQVMVDPNDDTAVMLSAFEASAIRRGVSAPAPSGP